VKGRTDLPVDPARLRAAFPALGEDELQAYVDVTRRLMGAGTERGKVLRRILELGRAEEGGAHGEEQELARRYLRAVSKMQGPAR
jgi:hypothetical protein